MIQFAALLPGSSTALDRGLLALSVVAGSLYVLTRAGPPPLPGLVLKALLVSPLAAIASSLGVPVSIQMIVVTVAAVSPAPHPDL